MLVHFSSTGVSQDWRMSRKYSARLVRRSADFSLVMVKMIPMCNTKVRAIGKRAPMFCLRHYHISQFNNKKRVRKPSSNTKGLRRMISHTCGTSATYTTERIYVFAMFLIIRVEHWYDTAASILTWQTWRGAACYQLHEGGNIIRIFVLLRCLVHKPFHIISYRTGVCVTRYPLHTAYHVSYGNSPVWSRSYQISRVSVLLGYPHMHKKHIQYTLNSHPPTCFMVMSADCWNTCVATRCARCIEQIRQTA